MRGIQNIEHNFIEDAGKFSALNTCKFYFEEANEIKRKILKHPALIKTHTHIWVVVKPCSHRFNQNSRSKKNDQFDSFSKINNESRKRFEDGSSVSMQKWMWISYLTDLRSDYFVNLYVEKYFI